MFKPTSINDMIEGESHERERERESNEKVSILYFTPNTQYGYSSHTYSSNIISMHGML